MCINFGHYDFGYEKLLQVLTCSATYLDAHCSILIPKFWLLRISLFHKCEDTYFVRLTKYLHIYEDTLGWRYLEMIAHLGCILDRVFSTVLHTKKANSAGGKTERLSVIISLLRAKFNVVHDSPKWKYVTSIVWWSLLVKYYCYKNLVIEAHDIKEPIIYNQRKNAMRASQLWNRWSSPKRGMELYKWRGGGERWPSLKKCN